MRQAACKMPFHKDARAGDFKIVLTTGGCASFIRYTYAGSEGQNVFIRAIRLVKNALSTVRSVLPSVCAARPSQAYPREKHFEILRFQKTYLRACTCLPTVIVLKFAFCTRFL